MSLEVHPLLISGSCSLGLTLAFQGLSAISAFLSSLSWNKSEIISQKPGSVLIGFALKHGSAQHLCCFPFIRETTYTQGTFLLFLFLICLGKSRQLLIHIKKLWHFSFPWLLSPAICRPHSEPHIAGLPSGEGCAVWSCPYFPFPWPWKEVALVTRQTSFSMKWEKNLLDVVCLQAWYGFWNVCRYGVVLVLFFVGTNCCPSEARSKARAEVTGLWRVFCTGL